MSLGDTLGLAMRRQEHPFHHRVNALRAYSKWPFLGVRKRAALPWLRKSQAGRLMMTRSAAAVAA